MRAARRNGQRANPRRRYRRTDKGHGADRKRRKPAREIKVWKKPRKIVVYVDNNPGRIAWLQEVAPGVTLVPVHNNAEAMTEIVDADGEMMGICNKGRIAAARNLH